FACLVLIKLKLSRHRRASLLALNLVLTVIPALGGASCIAIMAKPRHHPMFQNRSRLCRLSQ
ncbi:MAG: hypothetical protein ACX939_15405, partial [Hyphococcus sp.]